MVIKYTSENGYTGMIYGESSMRIIDTYGKEVLHTGFRTISTEAELKEFVDDFPNKRKSLLKLFENLSKEGAGDGDVDCEN